MSRTFNSLAQPSEFCFEEKRSRFLAFLYPAEAKNEIPPLLEALKNQYPDARHHCWAYVLGNPEQVIAAGFNDDGEPGGTAGKPMLNILLQRKVGNVAAFVVRYFGGIKLGAGGLTRAYGAAVSGAVDVAELITVHPCVTLIITLPFALEERIRNVLHKACVTNIRAVYTDVVTLSIQCETRIHTKLSDSIRDASAGVAQISVC